METHKEKSFPTVNNFLINQTPLAPVTPSKPQLDLHWNNQGPPSQPPSEAAAAAAKEDYPYLRAWEASRSTQWKNNMNLLAEEDPLNILTSFTDLLAVNGGIGTSGNYSSFNGGSVFFNQSESCRLEQQIVEIYGGEMKNCGSLHQYQSVCNSNTNAGISNFAPSTPESRWKIDSMGSDNTPLGTKNQTPVQQNEIKEQDVAAASINLQNVDDTAPNTESSSPQKDSVVEDNEKASDQVIDENKTPQKKARRRRYQPKVLSEKKPRKTPKPKTPKPTETKETPRVRKKYVRKNKVEAKTPSTPPKEANDEVGNTKPAETATKSCRRSINFNLNGQEAESNLANMSNGGADVEVQGKCDTERNQLDDTKKYRQGVEMVVEASKSGVAYDLNCALNQELEYYLSLHTDVNIPKRKESIRHDLSENNAEILSSSNAPHPAQSPNSSPCASSSEQKIGRGSKRSNPSIVEMDAGSMGTKHSTFWQPNHVFFGNANIEELQDFILPETCKKKRTEKVQRSHVSSICGGPPGYINPILGVPILPRVDPSASKYYCNPSPFGSKAVTNNLTNVLLKSVQYRSQLVNSWADLARLRKKRSKGTTRVRDPAKLMGLPSVFPAKRRPKGPRTKKIDIAENANTEALVVSGTANPISKKRSKKQNSEDKLGLVVFNGKSKRKRKGSIPALTWARSTRFIEAITERMKHLDISKDSCNTELKEKIQKELLQDQYALVPYRAHKQDQNALVVYGRDGTMVPFEGPFDPVKKRRPRAKVELDDETTKVWKLLLENIDNEGIDGTDEDKVKWWEKERSIFRGRVDSFIARMRLVQGDRRFSPWKGSVLDSVIGVFLTQNVSDHLSSSAFMSLAAHFPLKSEGNENTLSEESATNLVGEPDICVVELDESISWNEKTTNQVMLSNDPRSVHDVHYNDEKKVVNSKGVTRGAPESVEPKDYYDESSQKTPSSIVINANSPSSEIETAAILGDERGRDEATSSQQSVMSSQSSTNSPNLCTVEKMSIFSKNDSITQSLTTSSTSNYLDYSTSFLELLKMAESPFLHDSYNRTQQDPLGCMDHVTKDFTEAQGTGSRNYLLNLSDQFPHTKGFGMLEEDNRSPNTSTKNENSIPEQSNLTTETTVLTHEKSSDNIPRSFNENRSACYVFEGEKQLKQSQTVKESLDNIFSSPKRQVSSASKSSKSPQANADVLESTTEYRRESHEHKEVEQVSAPTYANASKSKKGKAGKEKDNATDWDRLRREAQPTGHKKERTASTRDSLDWEAVVHADASVIAEVIKERGMNNVLAKRIKELLDRLVKDHGSIDMEWLRDIPPDKAKEYLLSFNGLGLKSVECVRLLTLHHLAFPVDTNVARIAVRLGWVPLQPLPESLQLHLLEMYPIMESIQKFLWPRLCKLDQKTLYELHYHLITFGKVFCTKRQPNCNACPLRAECRHFASAFASARFALPATEEKSIVPSGVSSSTHSSSQASSNLLALPPAFSSQHSQNNPKCVNIVPTIEVPPSPMDLPLPETISHLERQSKTTCSEPIVEVPPSPEPEPEQEQGIYDIEDTFYEDSDEIPTIRLNMEELSQTIQNYINSGESNALVALTPEAASIPTPKLKNISRLRTEHHVYELPDTHPLLDGMDKREPDDPCPYLLAIWTPGETPDSIQPPERRCNAEDPNLLCNEVTCSYCNSLREANSQIVRGTLLIPCRTANRGSFPLNGTYFQVNEVFADHDSSLSPIAVPRCWLWNLPRRTVYFGTSIPTIFRGMRTEDIQHCFWRGFVCVRGFDQKRRVPRPLMARLHFVASRTQKGEKAKAYDE